MGWENITVESAKFEEGGGGRGEGEGGKAEQRGYEIPARTHDHPLHETTDDRLSMLLRSTLSTTLQKSSALTSKLHSTARSL